jgi:hypothetical protein
MRVFNGNDPGFRWVCVVIATGLLAGAVAPIPAQTIGVTADSAALSVTVFDADTDTVLGVVAIPPGGIIGDCVVTADQTQAFVANAFWKIWVIDLTTTPPMLALGTNPIVTTSRADDLSITPDGRFLVVTSGGSTQPLSVVDIASRVEVSTFLPGFDVNSVEVGSDGSVLATSLYGNSVHRFTISESGILTDTGERMDLRFPNNVFVAPGGTVGVAVARQTKEIRSFAIPGMQVMSVRYASGDYGISGVFHPAGGRAYVRSGWRSPGYVESFGLDTDASGRLQAAADFSVVVPDGTSKMYGVDQMAIHPDGTKLYVSQRSRLAILDAATGASLGSITASMRTPNGVYIAPRMPDTTIEVPVDFRPLSQRNRLLLSSRGIVPVAILSTETFDATSVDVPSVTVAGAPVAVFCKQKPMAFAMDVNRDEARDLVVFVRVSDMELTVEDTEIVVEGKTLDDKSFTGKDDLTVLEHVCKRWGHWRHHKFFRHGKHHCSRK